MKRIYLAEMIFVILAAIITINLPGIENVLIWVTEFACGGNPEDKILMRSLCEIKELIYILATAIPYVILFEKLKPAFKNFKWMMKEI